MASIGEGTATNRNDHRIPQRPAAIGTGTRPRSTTAAAGASLLGAIVSAIVMVLAIGTGTAAALPAPRPPAPIRPAPAPPVLPDDPYSLFVGRSYASVADIGGAIPGGGPMRIVFGPGHRVGLYAGCNRHVGTATITGDQMRIGPLASTRMACPPPRSESDRWLASFTSVPLTWHVLGPVLTLSSPIQTVLLTETTVRTG